MSECGFFSVQNRPAVETVGRKAENTSEYPQAPASLQFDVGCCWAHGGWKLLRHETYRLVFFDGKLSCFLNGSFETENLDGMNGFQHVQGDTGDTRPVIVFPRMT